MNLREEFSCAAVNLVLAAAQLLIFMVNMAMGGRLFGIWSLKAEAVIQGHQFWRLFTVALLHLDMQHLFNNLVGQIFLGSFVERNLGHLRYALFYLTCVLGASLCSIAHALRTSWNGSSVGSSGAVFGIMGAAAVIIFYGFRHYRGPRSLRGRAVFMIFYAFYVGLRSTNIDNAAHAGGLVTGILMCSLLMIGRDPDLRGLI